MFEALGLRTTMLNNLHISQRFIAIMAMYWATFLASARTEQAASTTDQLSSTAHQNAGPANQPLKTASEVAAREIKGLSFGPANG